MVVQDSIPAGSEICEEVDRWIESLVQADDFTPPTLTQVLQVVKTVQQHQLLAGLPPSNPPLALVARVGPHNNKTFLPITYPVLAYLDLIPEEDWEEALSFYATPAGQCWLCGAQGHQQRDCPKRAARTRGFPPHRQFGGQSTGGGQGAFYPLRMQAGRRNDCQPNARQCKVEELPDDLEALHINTARVENSHSLQQTTTQPSLELES